MSFDEDETNERHEQRITHCASCHAQIIWFKTDGGKNMPVDADTVEPADEKLDLSRHKSHFATCPNADLHRRARR